MTQNCLFSASSRFGPVVACNSQRFNFNVEFLFRLPLEPRLVASSWVLFLLLSISSSKHDTNPLHCRQVKIFQWTKMSRRITRLQNQETQESVEIQHPTPVEAKNNKKRKALAVYTQGSSETKKKATKSKVGKGNKPPSQAQFGSANDALSSLPPEILLMILDNVSRWTQGIVSSLRWYQKC